MAQLDVEQALKMLLNDELCALAAYRQAIERIHDSPTCAALDRIEGNHEEVISHLKIALIDRGEDPRDDPLFLGPCANVVRTLRDAYGDEAILTALRTIEERCLADCDATLDSTLLGDTTRRLVRDVVLPRLEARLAHLDALFRERRGFDAIESGTISQSLAVR